jgi:hypothetical protein
MRPSARYLTPWLRWTRTLSAVKRRYAPLRRGSQGLGTGGDRRPSSPGVFGLSREVRRTERQAWLAINSNLPNALWKERIQTEQSKWQISVTSCVCSSRHSLKLRAQSILHFFKCSSLSSVNAEHVMGQPTSARLSRILQQWNLWFHCWNQLLRNSGIEGVGAQ